MRIPKKEGKPKMKSKEESTKYRHTRTNYLGDDDLEYLDWFKTDILSSHDTEITLYHGNINTQSSEGIEKLLRV